MGGRVGRTTSLTATVLTLGVLLATPACSGDDGPAAATPGTGADSAPATRADGSPVPAPATVQPTAVITGPAGDSQESLLDSVPGSAGAACAKVTSQSDVRAGSVVVGNFTDARAQYRAKSKEYKPTVHLNLWPGTIGDGGASITITPMGGTGSGTTVTSEVAHPADAWSYFPFDVPVAAAGTWRLTATAGASTGCFEVTFTT